MTDNCAAFTSMLVRVADGTAPAAEQAQLEAHIATCASCAAALDDQRGVHAWLQVQPVTGASLGFDRRVMAAVRADAENRTRSWLDNLDFRRWTWRLVPVAAALALVAVSVTQTDAGNQIGQADATTLSGTATDTMPVSSALWSEAVSESSLLSLMLSANADDTLGSYRKDQ